MQESPDVVDDSVLSAVLDTVLPPNGELPGAGGLGLAASYRQGAAQAPHLGASAAAVLVALPEGFVGSATEEREAVLRRAEEEDPQSFAALLNLAYNAYYTDQRVLERIESLTGYAARPPQPEGYELEPFDERVLAQVKERAPFWREA